MHADLHMLARLSAHVRDFRADLMDSGPFKFIKDELAGVLKWVERLEEDGSLAALAKEWGEKLTGALKKVKEGLIAGWECLKKWGPKIRELVTAMGGAKAVAIALGVALGGPLIGALGKAIRSVGLLGKALALTPVGLLLTAAGGIAALMHEAGVLTPFLEGLKEGFGGLREAIGPSLSGLVDSLAGLFGTLGLNLRDVDGNINPEAWRELGKAVAEFTNGKLADLIDMLTKAVNLLKEIGGGLGYTAGRIVAGDVESREAAVRDGNLALAEYGAAMKKSGNRPSPESEAALQRVRQGGAKYQESINTSGSVSSKDLSAKTYGQIRRERQVTATAGDSSRPTPSDIKNPESITGPLSGKLDAVNDTLSKPQNIGNPGDITGPIVALLQTVAAKVNQPLPLNIALKVSGSVNGANVQTEAKVTSGGQVSDKAKLAMGHRGATP